MIQKFLLFFLVASTSCWALDCRQAQTPSPVTSSVQQMIENAQSFRSLEDFLVALPDEMKSNFTMLADSKSFHTSNLENPRVVLSSNDGRVRVSYNTIPGSRGSNAIEISMWNPETMSFEYKEIKAPSDNLSLKANESPVACASCHGNPPKPNLEAPDRWAGAIPFVRDTLISNSEESRWYKNYLEKIEDRNPDNFRFNLLRPPMSLEAFTANEENSSMVQVSSLPDGSFSERAYQQSAHLMRCFQAKRIGDRPNFHKLKYLLAGLKLGCDPASFMQDWNFQAARDYFQGRVGGLAALSGSRQERYQQLRNQVIQDTQTRQAAAHRRSEGRQQAFWLENYLDPTKVDEDLAKNLSQIPGVKNNTTSDAQKVADVRMMLEPLGIQVSRFSLSRDPFDYNFSGEFQADYILDEEVRNILSENTSELPACEFLAQKNAIALEGLKAKAQKFSLNICEQRQRVDQRMQDLISNNTTITRHMISQQASKIMTSKCMACHQATSESGTNIGAMVIPFDDIGKVESLIQSDAGRLTELRDVMRDRINRPHGHQGAMPVSFVTDMSEDDKAYLSLWLDGLGE